MGSLTLQERGSTRTHDEMKKAAYIYAFTGKVAEVVRTTGIPERTVYDWRKKSEKFSTYLQEARKEKQEELDANLSEIIHKTQAAMLNRIEFGDDHVLKTGDIIKKAISFRDLAVGGAVSFDKRALLRGDPTSRVEKVSIEAILHKISITLEESGKAIAKSALDMPQTKASD